MIDKILSRISFENLEHIVKVSIFSSSSFRLFSLSPTCGENVISTQQQLVSRVYATFTLNPLRGNNRELIQVP